MLYAIVDIETTGGNANTGNITEIAIAIHDGKKVIHFYETLVNPHQPIPYFIQRLTNISQEMVDNAPSFETVAPHIYELLHDKVFVAHNVNFDYSFVKKQLEESGYTINLKKLCTVRLSRKILPGMSSYSLGKLCHQLQINHADRHRAGGDTLATAHLFSLLIEKDTTGVIEKMLKGKNSEQYLPPHVPIEQVNQLPQKPGVYYFYNRSGKVIYIGKAKNISKRVKTHFANNKTNKQKQDFLREINRIGYKECGTELFAQILESIEIRKLWPLYNRSQRGYLAQYGLYLYEDRNGYFRLTIEKKLNTQQPLYTFNSLFEGRQRLLELIQKFALCPMLCNVVKDGDCTQLEGELQCKGNCKTTAANYNKKVRKATNWLAQQLPTFAFVDKGIYATQKSCILVSKGSIYGMGYVEDEHSFKDETQLQNLLEPLQDNDFIRNLVYKHAAQFPEKCVLFN